MYLFQDGNYLPSRADPTIHKRNHNIYVFTTGGNAPMESNVAQILSNPSQYSVACIGYNCHAKPNPPRFGNWNFIGSVFDSKKLKIAMTMFDKKINELQQMLLDLQARDTPHPMTNHETSISNTIRLLNHVVQRVEQRITDMDHPYYSTLKTRFIAEQEFFMHPYIHMEVEFEVVFYHGPIHPTSFPMDDHIYWADLFRNHTIHNDKRFLDSSHASAIDIIYPIRNDRIKQKLCEYEGLYGISDGAIRESNRIKREKQEQEARQLIEKQLQAEKEAEEAEKEAQRLYWAAFYAEKAEKKKIKDAEDAAREIAAKKPSLLMTKISNMFFPGMGGRTKRSKGSKRYKRYKRSKGTKRSN